MDSAPVTGCPVIATLQDSDFVVLVTEPTPSAFADLKRILEVVEHFKIPWPVVINKWDINKDLSNKIEKWSRLRQDFGLWLDEVGLRPDKVGGQASKRFLGKISYEKEIFKAVSNFKPILETNLKAKKEIQIIYTSLLERIEKDSISI